ncbi:spartin isoform X1 [Lycorma delicatula]|uniref:spartin isoform X1 n=1 Tax=Lycorma delicatula TaxID=130591 RepID=UPI003F519B97
MATGPTEDWNETFKTLKEFHDLSYVKLDEGIKLEEEGKKDIALSKYEEGLRLMDLALELRIECPANADYTWEKACVMVEKLRKTRKEVLSRIAAVQVTLPQQPDPYLAPPPTYEEAMSAPSSLSPTSPTPPSLVTPSTSAAAASSSKATSNSGPKSSVHNTIPNSGPMTYSQLGEALNNLKVETNSQSAQVLYTYENVKIYFIQPDGNVTAPSEPSTLRVLELEGGASEVAKFFLQVGEWFYPLVPNVSPCLRAEYGAYILPDVHSGEEGAAIGLIFPPETDESMYELLEDLLHNVIVLEKPMASPAVAKPSSRSTTFSQSLIYGGTHKHHKKLLGHGARRKHRGHYRHDGHYRNLDNNEIDNELSTLTDQNNDGIYKRHKHHRRHHRRHHHGNHDDSEGRSYGEPPPYDEIGRDVNEVYENEGEEEEEKEIVDDEDKKSERKHDKDKSSRRHKRHFHYPIGRRSKIEKGAQFISNSLLYGAEKASQLINYSTPKIMEKVTPEPTPRQIPHNVKKGVEVARNVSGSAVVVTGYVAGKIGDATMALGRYLGPHIQKHGTTLLSTAGGMDEKVASERVKSVLEVTAGAVEGFSTVYSGLEQSASILGQSLANNTVQLVQHKYGQPMGEVTGNTLSTFGNVLAARNNVKIFTPKGLAKRTAKDTGKAVIHDFRQELRNDQHNLNEINNDKFDLDKFEKSNQLDKPGPSN